MDITDKYVDNRPINRSTAITRTNVQFMNDILGWEFPVLDHGFVRVIDYMGDDKAIENAARISYGAGTRKKTETQGLINYLMKHNHTSPFEMCEIKLHVKLPIFVARQWVRHRTASINEYSSRYSVLQEEFHIPKSEDIKAQSTTNKQGRGEMLDGTLSSEIRHKIESNSQSSYDLYKWLVSDDVNMTRELARISLPSNIYTQWIWKTNLHNLLHFIMLRNDSHAQKEIRDYAQLIEWIVMGWVPLTWYSYYIHKKQTISFSAHEVLIIQHALSMPSLDENDKPCWAESFSMREWKEFVKKIKRIRIGN